MTGVQTCALPISGPDTPTERTVWSDCTVYHIGSDPDSVPILFLVWNSVLVLVCNNVLVLVLNSVLVLVLILNSVLILVQNSVLVLVRNSVLDVVRNSGLNLVPMTVKSEPIKGSCGRDGLRAAGLSGFFSLLSSACGEVQSQAMLLILLKASLHITESYLSGFKLASSCN